MTVTYQTIFQIEIEYFFGPVILEAIEAIEILVLKNLKHSFFPLLIIALIGKSNFSNCWYKMSVFLQNTIRIYLQMETFLDSS